MSTSYYQQSVAHCLSDANRAEVEALCDTLAPYEQLLKTGGDAKAAPILSLCARTDDLGEMVEVAGDIRARFKHVIICGAGGSALSGRVLSSLRLYHQSPHLYVLDNIDPSAMDALLACCPPEETLVIAISKSGKTAETLSQFYALLAHYKTILKDKMHQHFMVITMDADSPMRRAAKEYNIRMFTHPADIGGRFSLFTIVGLLPALLAGVDATKLRQGALSAINNLGEGIHPARMGAALQYTYMQHGCNMSVMLPYCERLAGFSAWYRQSWSESLGKGGSGTTPISAVGTTDQHSQLQLYLDGPKDKFFTMIMHQRAGTGQPIHAPQEHELAYLKGRTTGDIMEAEQKATLETLAGHGRPVRTLYMDTLTEESLGALLAHFMLEIFFMAKLLGVHAFDQPAVEEGKQRARDYLLASGQ